MKLNTQEIKAAVNIIDIIGSAVTLRKAGAEFVGLCPFHKDNSPSLYVNDQKQVFICRACGVGGDVVDFIREFENLSFVEAIDELAKAAGIEISEEKRDVRPSMILKANERALELYRVKAPLDWIKERGYPESFEKTFQVGLAPASGRYIYEHAKREGWLDEAVMAGLVREDKDKPGEYYDFFRNRVIFPIISSKRLIAFGGRDISGNARAKYLNSSEHLLYSKSRIFYGIDLARRSSKKKKEMVVSEGYTDLWALHRAGLSNSLATCGTALTPEHGKILARMVDGVVLCYDGDLAGAKAVHRALGVCLGAGLPVRIAKPPDGMDPDDMDPQALSDLVKEAPDAIQYYANEFSDIDVRHQKRMLEDLRRFIYGSPSSILKGLYLNEVERHFKVELKPPSESPSDDTVVDVMQRAVYAVMQDYGNADILFEDVPDKAITGSQALSYLFKMWSSGADPSTWVMAAPESTKKKLVSSIGSLKFTKKSVARVRLLILHKHLTDQMIRIEEKISTAESLGNDANRFIEEWERVDKERRIVDADLRVSV